MHALSSCFVLGYHGCSLDTAHKLVLREEKFRPSSNDYDWLGSGIYFWLEDPRRACEWACSNMRNQQDKPAVVGAVIDLGICLDLTTRSGIESIRTAYETLKMLMPSGRKLPVNSKASPNDGDRLIRRLDCAVINMTCDLIEKRGGRVDTVKGVFLEGEPAYGGTEIRQKTHTQIAVRNPECIRGIFIPPVSDFGEDVAEKFPCAAGSI